MPRPKGGSKSDWVKLAIAGIDDQIKELTSVRDQLAKLGAAPVAATVAAAPRVVRRRAKKAVVAKPAKKKRLVTAATRKKLKESAKARWAKIRAERGE